MSPTVQNLLAAGMVVVGILLVRMASRREHWRLAWRQLSANRLAMISLAIISMYVVLGLLDSIAWRDRASDSDGNPAVDAAGGAVYDARARTILDRACARLTNFRERTYSAPLAGRLHTKETVIAPDGKKRRIHPPLDYPNSHVLGTNQIGTDVLYLALKGIRTALIIGAFPTLLVIPIGILFGVAAGYYGGRIDDAIQYVYTTLSSIPDYLLIIAFMMFADVMFPGVPRLIPISIILGITSWTGLCRLLRGETLKLRELEYVQAARAAGMGHLRIITRHIVPNLLHIVVITSVLRFSVLVLAEAVLSYLNIGVEPGTGSWGHMINAARQELSREPVVWWNLTAAFIFMVGLVLPVNLFGDALRDSLDPKLRT